MRSIKMNNSKIEYSKSEVRTDMKGFSEWEKLSSGVSGFIANWPSYFRRTAFISVLAIVCAFCMLFPVNAEADTAGPNNPSNSSNNSSIGNTSWSNTSNIRYSDNSDARASLSGGRTSNYLIATDFGFSIPSDATITGIKVDIEKADGNQSSSADIRDYSVKIVKNGSITGSDYANTSIDWSTSDQWTSYGSSSDLWGTTWTTADINSGNFGAAISARNTSSSRTEYAYVDNIRITVYYSVAPVCTPNTPTVNITPSSQTITTDGGSAVYSVTIKNNDLGSGCSNVTYSLSASDSNTSNFNASALGSSSVTLSAAATSSAIALTVSGKAGHTSGTDIITVTASASGHSNGNGTVSTTLNVYVPPVFDSAGPNNPSSSSNNSSIGNMSWSYTSYIKSSDNSDARVYLDGDHHDGDHHDEDHEHHSHKSNYLVATGFGFSIPSNATITGIKLDIEKAEGNRSYSAYIRDNSVKIVKNGLITGSEHANVYANWSVSDQWTSYGSNSDLWGTTWTPADINSGNFGAALSARNTSLSNGEYAYVDNMRITVYFSVPSPCTETVPTVNVTPSSQTITTNGGSVAYSITITNNDTVGCLNAIYSLSSSDSNTTNFNVSTLGSSSVTLAPGETSAAITLTVIGKAGQTTGTDTTTIKASASGHADGSNSVITTLDVPGCIAMAPTVNITPYSRTITANGGSGAYSMTIRNNDAGIGCPNVVYSLSASDSNIINFNASTLGSSSVTLASGATSSAIILTVSGRAGHTSGINLTTVTASASGHENGISSTVTTTLNISATNTYTISTCNDCHKTVPVDATGQRGTPPTAVIGSHSVHAAIHGNACTTCHIDTSSIGHRNGLINMNNPINGGSYSKGMSFPQINDMTGAGLGTCSNTYCHGSAGTSPKWGTNTSKIGTCDLCHGMVGTNPSRDTEGQTAVTDPQVGAHNAHLNATHNLSSKIDCSECHTVPVDLDSPGHYDTARPAEVPLNGTIANTKGAMPSYTAGQCSNTWCHGAKLFEGDKPPTWNVPLLTGNNNDCTQCHGFPPSQGVHSGLDVNKAGECAGCHDHVNATNDGFIDPSKHINGTVDGGSCTGCHSTPRGNRVAVVGQFSANSHHVQGVTLTDEHCYQCHWEANSDGSLNSTYHEGLSISGAPVDLVIYGNGARPSAYTLGTTAVKYTAGATGGGGSPLPPFSQLDEFNGVTHNTKVTSNPGATNWTAKAGSDGANSWCYGTQATASSSTGSNPGNPVPFVFLETSSGTSGCNDNVSLGSSQYLESNILDASTYDFTFTFDYNMEIGGNGSLHLDAYNGSSWDLDVTGGAIASGTQGSAWHTAGPYDLSGYSNSNFKLRLRFVVSSGGSSYQNDIMFDNLDVNAGGGSGGGALRPELLKINQHCLGCHSTPNNSVQPFADGKTPKQYSWDGTSVNDRYSQTGTATWGKYSGTNVNPKNTQTKAYSAHGNASANQRGWNTSETWPNTSGTSQVLCFDCHNSHGSSVSGTTTSYTSGAVNGGILKDTIANMGGYTITYKPTAGGSVADHNLYNAGAGLCFDCHLTANGGTIKPWGYQSTFGASQAIMGYMDTEFFGPGTFGRQIKYPYKSTANMGGHFGASSAMSASASKAIGGLCTPCHDPHGVSTTLGTNQKYGVPLLKGTWLTSPYKEDATTADNQNYIGIAAFDYRGEYEGPNRSQAKKDAQAAAMKAYRIDQNTFGSGDNSVMNSTLYSISETDSQFAGLCLNCHQKQKLTNGTTHTWKSKDRIHESVRDWKTANSTKQHSFTCSKCHAPHNASLPRLMITNCLDSKHRGRVTNNNNPITSGSYRDSGSGSGRMPGSYSARVGEDGRTTINKTFTCHENNDPTQKWNTKTPWIK